jgi:hypothetical protein
MPSSARWSAAPRPFPDRLVPPDYPAHTEVRRVSTAGTFRLGARRQPFLSHALSGQDIALEEVDDETWNIVYFRHRLWLQYGCQSRDLPHVVLVGCVAPMRVPHRATHDGGRP